MIGENGKNLISFTHLARKMAEKTIGEIVFFSVDINDYQAKKIEDLKNLARLNSQRVRYFKKEIALRPMSSFERRVIHIALADCPDVVTESQGEGLNRQILIKPFISH
ncbi:unnamed protein product [marine sediment metagenome]|uniref:R3H domain-containing protein n=1 Tax=marine sediment metagenome TaxID=412755 RepID=X1TGF5_9ZZZZ